MEKATPISNIKDNSSEINNILNQIEEDNKMIQEIPPQQPQQIIEEEFEEPEDESSVLDILWYEFKGPLLVAVLCILYSLPGPNDVVENYIPFMWSDVSESLNYLGSGVKALLFGIIYFIIYKYLL